MTKEQFTPALIQYRLKLRGITQKDIAKELGCSPNSVSKIINFQKVSHRLMRHIAELIGEDVRVVFAWYFGDTARIKRAPRTKK